MKTRTGLQLRGGGILPVENGGTGTNNLDNVFIRTNGAQSLSDTQKNYAKYNIAVAVDGGRTTTGTIGWYNVAKFNCSNTTRTILMTIVQTHYAVGYQNIKLLINSSDADYFVITQLSGTLGSTSATQLDKVRIRIVDDTAYIDIHQQSTAFNRNTIYFEDLQSEEFRNNSTYFLQTVDFELVSSDTGVVKELSLVAGFATTGNIYQNSEQVANLSQVVRTDTAQSLNVVQKQQALNNVGHPYKSGYSTQKQWLRAAKISFPYAPSSGGYNIVFLVGESNNYTTFGLLQLSGTTQSGVGFYETFLRYIDFNSSSTQEFDPGYIKAVKVNNLELDLYIQQTSKNYTIVGLQVLSNFGEQKPDITVLLEAADDPGSGSNVTYASEPTVRANYISSNGAPVLVGFASSVSGTSGSVKLPGGGWYCINYSGTILSQAYSTGVFYWNGDATYLPVSAYLLGSSTVKRAVNISLEGTVTVFDPDSGTSYTDFTVDIYKLA